ncbi:MAG: choice-of-anchor J domain-containing protein [Lentimicrobium sp.]|nr:choice-of-anchor J domain-containing protein [Lentimicrobium sp.]
MRCFRFLLLCAVIAGIKASAQTYMRNGGNPEPSAIEGQHTAKESVQILSGVFEEGFEAYDDFAGSFPQWTTIDIDGRPTWGIESITFPNQYSPMSFIIFNPSATNPPMVNSAIQPEEGSKFAACFSANAMRNDDWLISPPLQAVANTSVSFYVKSYTSQYGLERYRVGISTTDNEPSSFTFITGPNYLTAPADEWQMKTFDLNEFNGQTIYVAINCISDQAFIFMVDEFRFSTTLPEFSSITGLVTDATNGEPIEGAEVCISGICTITDEDGNYSIDQIPQGSLDADFVAYPAFGSAPLEVQFSDQSTENTHSVSCERDGYLTYTNSQVSLLQGGSLSLNISLSPTLQEGNLRFVLNWGPVPSDLDSHLLTPEIEGTGYHVYYDDEGSISTAPFALLDYDITTGYGPETMTIYQLKSGFYRYYVQNFSESPPILQSRAVVQIYGVDGLLETVQVPGSGIGNYWHVCDINGETGEILLVNVIQEDAPYGFLKTNVPKTSSSVQEETHINFWLWDFGDGNISNQRNPVHTYSQTGNFTVSLTVGNGVTLSQKVKPLYIQVGTQSNLSVGREDLIHIYPVPARELLKVKSGYRILKVEIFSMSGHLLDALVPNDSEALIDISIFTNGIYLLQINTSEGNFIRKFNKI